MNLFQIIYALLAMSLIKPAEKFFRDMFGMNGKVAGTASHESGKAFMDATAKLVKDATIAITTGGASIAKGAIAGGVDGLAKGTGIISKAGGFIGGFAKGAKNEFIRQDNFEKLATFKNSADGFQNGLSAGVADAGAKNGFFSNELGEFAKKRAEDRIQGKAAEKNDKEDNFYVEYFLDKNNLRGAYGNAEREKNEADAAYKNKKKSLYERFGKYVDVDNVDFATLLAYENYGKKKGIYDAEEIIKRFNNPESKKEADENNKYIDDINNRMNKFNWDNDSANQSTINAVATKKEDIDFLADRLFRDKYKGKYKDEQKEKDLARKDAEAQLKEMAEKYSYFENQMPGATSLHNMMTFEIIAKDNGWKSQKQIVENFDKIRMELNTNTSYAKYSDEIEKTQLAYNQLKQKLEQEVQNSLTGTFTFIDEDGKGTDIDSSELLLGNADEIIKSQVDMIMEKYKSTGVFQVNDWNTLNQEAEYRKKIIDNLWAYMNMERSNNGGTYELVCEDGNNLIVTSKNLNKPEVRDALRSKVKYVEAGADRDDIKLLNRLEHTKVTLEKNNIKDCDASKIMDVDNLIELYRSIPENQRFNQAKTDPHLSDELRKVLGAELKARK